MSSRKTTAFALLALIAGLIAMDAGRSAPLAPYKAPPLLALGSGMAGTGAHCAALPAR